jgi:hypothetical protein
VFLHKVDTLLPTPRNTSQCHVEAYRHIFCHIINSNQTNKYTFIGGYPYALPCTCFGAFVVIDLLVLLDNGLDRGRNM